MEGVAILASLLFFGVVIWVASMSMDKERITRYIEGRGGRIVSINWAPFGRGWFGEKNDRIYEVVYHDRAGSQHWATCKTSMFSGVYWTEDRVTYPKSAWYDSLSPGNESGKPLIRQIPEFENDEAVELRQLREENARLRAALRGTATGECPACGTSTPQDAKHCPACAIRLT